MPTQIAIDGPVGAGKSTIARECAKRLGFVYMDTGALYRSVGVYCKENNVDPYNEKAVSDFLPQITLEIKLTDGVQHIIINNSDVTERLRTPEASMLASKVSSYGSVREFLLDLQRDYALKNNAVMDGRDIGTVVLPNAKVKIFLSADPKVRAMRRFKELQEKGGGVAKVSFDEVLADLQKRDKDDSSRAHAPLKQADDAVLVDTTHLDFEQSVEAIMQVISDKLL